MMRISLFGVFALSLSSMAAHADPTSFDGTMTGTMNDSQLGVPTASGAFTATIHETVNRTTHAVSATVSNFNGAPVAALGPVSSFGAMAAQAPLTGKSYAGGFQQGNIGGTLTGSIVGLTSKGTFSASAFAGGNGYTLNGTFTAHDPPSAGHGHEGHGCDHGHEGGRN